MVFEMLKYLYVCDEILDYHIDDEMNMYDNWDYNKKVNVKVK